MLIFIILWIALAGWFLALWYGRKFILERDHSRNVYLECLRLKADNRALRRRLAKASPLTFKMHGVDQTFHPVDLVLMAGRDVPLWRN